MKVYFVILHYINIEETKKCVKSILTLNNSNDSNIIIVDNGSNNGTGEELLTLYKDVSNIEVIISKLNEGFARGNNTGISHIKDKLNSLVVVCNSDLIFNDKEFINQCVDIYNKEHYAVLGPDVTSEDLKVHENPTKLEINNDKELNEQIKRFRLLNKLNSLGLINLSRFIHKVTKVSNKKYPFEKEMDNKEIAIKVHGSCFVLSPKYFEKYDGLFDGTFLFQEENILGNMCLNSGLLVLYSPKPQVIHLGSRSYKTKYSNPRKRFKNYVSNVLNSLEAYKKYLEEENSK